MPLRGVPYYLFVGKMVITCSGGTIQLSFTGLAQNQIFTQE
jgi:hypothetical protein